MSERHERLFVADRPTGFESQGIGRIRPWTIFLDGR
jgi:hypothetical protein